MPRVRERLSLATARRIALAAQGFADPLPTGAPDRRHLRRVLGRTNLLQMDSVNVFQRAHYLPAYSRLGAYDMGLVDRLAYKDRELFEYWGHEASLLPVALHPLLRWRMERAHNLEEGWGGVLRAVRDKPEFVAEVLRLVRELGPVSAGDLREGERREKGTWWSWDQEKVALEYLFWSGQVTTASRRGFERLYDVPERVLPRAVVDTPTPSLDEAHRGLVSIAARAHGVATAQCLRDYFRTAPEPTLQAIAELVESGELLPVRIDGWKRPAYLHKDARMPRRVNARALVSPFDSLVFERTRTEVLFGFRYRIEIYVPAEKRIHGYYVLPFLLGDRLVARVDLKADRAAGVLLVQSAHAEPKAPVETAEELATELVQLAGWLGLDQVRVAGGGDLSPALSDALRGY